MDPAQLKNYYDQKALQLDEFTATYNSDVPIKRFFYRRRAQVTMAMLDPRPYESILDIGCGSGFYLQEIARAGCRAIGLDVSLQYLLQSSRRLGPSVQLIAGDAACIPIRDNTIDKVLITEVIEHVPSYLDVIREVQRVLKTGGRAIFTTPNRYSYMNLAYAAKRRIKRYQFNEHVREFSLSEFKQLLRPYFILEDIAFANYVVPYPVDAIFGRIGQLGVSIAGVGENMLARLPIVSAWGWTMVVRVRKEVGEK